MPLRDHFHSPVNDRASWEGFHGQWPAMIVMALSRKLPPRYLAEPYISCPLPLEIDPPTAEPSPPVWVPPKPIFSVASDLPEQDEYEVRVYDANRGRKLVAAIEIVSPANKDRPEHRRAFVAKCAALLEKLVSVTIIDLVTTRNFNLFGDLLELIGQPPTSSEAPPLYAVACRVTEKGTSFLLEAWEYALTLGQPLPTLPLWLADNLAVPLELENCYEETCRILRIP